MPTADISALVAEVTALGAEGDGIIHAGGMTLFAPFTLPGETVLYSRSGDRAVIEQRLRESPDRVRPPCGLFARCGGCALQHLAVDATASFKRHLVESALRDAGYELPGPIAEHTSPPYARRRMDLALRRSRDGMLVGLHQRGGDVVDMTECHVLHPRLFRLIEDARPVLMRLSALRGTGSLLVNLLETGPDLLLSTDEAPGTADRARLAEFARAAGVPRIAWRHLKPGGTPEIVCAIEPVRHTLSGVAVVPPPDAFLQATLEGEAAIVAAVLDAMPQAWPRGARVVEFFAGCGTLTFALARRGRVLAVEGHQASALCLRSAAGGLPIEVLNRDLNRQPILAADLGRASAIVLDPPYAGSGAQMQEVARSGVERVVMVSCNPKALRRDAKMLHKAGYALERVTVVDQFLWSVQVESVAAFVRPRVRRHVKHR